MLLGSRGVTRFFNYESDHKSTLHYILNAYDNAPVFRGAINIQISPMYYEYKTVSNSVYGFRLILPVQNILILVFLLTEMNICR